MKNKLAAILALTVILLCPFYSWAQQPIKHFGYAGPTTDTDLSRVRSYTDFTYVDGVYGQSISGLATRVKNNGMEKPLSNGEQGDPVLLAPIIVTLVGIDQISYCLLVLFHRSNEII